tara:strand:- start:446 stop:640 length:195 start_codon:yes stop_codon:yes gene_type:complete
MNGEGCDICEMANVRVRQVDTTTVEVTDNAKDGVSKKLITIGIFACDDCYKDDVRSEFIAQMKG